MSAPHHLPGAHLAHRGASLRGERTDQAQLRVRADSRHARPAADAVLYAKATKPADVH
jgi:hypothetical protein